MGAGIAVRSSGDYDANSEWKMIREEAWRCDEMRLTWAEYQATGAQKGPDKESMCE